MDDEVIGDLTKEDLLKVGFVTGNAIKFLKAFVLTSSDMSLLSISPSSPRAAPPTSPAVQPHSSAAAAAAGVAAASSAASSPAPASDGKPLTLMSSNFKRQHAAVECPELQHQLFSSMHSFLTLMCVRYKQPASAGKDLFLRLQGESFECNAFQSVQFLSKRLTALALPLVLDAS
jgi:hypothetical protein